MHNNLIIYLLAIDSHSHCLLAAAAAAAAVVVVAVVVVVVAAAAGCGGVRIHLKGQQTALDQLLNLQLHHLHLLAGLWSLMHMISIRANNLENQM